MQEFMNKYAWSRPYEHVPSTLNFNGRKRAIGQSKNCLLNFISMGAHSRKTIKMHHLWQSPLVSTGGEVTMVYSHGPCIKDIHAIFHMYCINGIDADEVLYVGFYVLRRTFLSTYYSNATIPLV